MPWKTDWCKGWFISDGPVSADSLNQHIRAQIALESSKTVNEEKSVRSSDGAWRYLWALYRSHDQNWQKRSAWEFQELLFTSPANCERYLDWRPGSFQKMWTDHEPKEYYPDNFVYVKQGQEVWFILLELPVDLIKPSI